MNKLSKEEQVQIKNRNHKLLVALVASLMLMLMITLGFAVYVIKDLHDKNPKTVSNECCQVEVLGHRSDAMGNVYLLTKEGWVAESQLKL